MSIKKENSKGKKMEKRKKLGRKYGKQRT